MENIQILVAFTKSQKVELEEYSKMIGLSYAGFIRSATLEKINRMKFKESEN